MNYKLLFIVSLIIVGVLSILYIYIGFHLLYESKSDSECTHIFTFGTNPERYAFSEEIFKKDNNLHWIISDPHAYVVERMIEKGYSNKRITPYFDANSTIDEIRFIKRYIKEKPNQKLHILLVSSPYHMGRIQFLCKRLGLHKKATLSFMPVPYSYKGKKMPDDYHTKWWKYRSLRREAFKYTASLFIIWR